MPGPARDVACFLIQVKIRSIPEVLIPARTIYLVAQTNREYPFSTTYSTFAYATLEQAQARLLETVELAAKDDGLPPLEPEHILWKKRGEHWYPLLPQDYETGDSFHHLSEISLACLEGETPSTGKITMNPETPLEQKDQLLIDPKLMQFALGFVARHLNLLDPRPLEELLAEALEVSHELAQELIDAVVPALRENSPLN